MGHSPGKPRRLDTVALQNSQAALEDGNLAGLWHALHLFQEQHSPGSGLPPMEHSEGPVYPLPSWLYEALFEVLAAYFGGSGAGKEWYRRWRKDQEHWLRWDYVEAARRANENARENWRFLQESKPAGSQVSENRRIAEEETKRTLRQTAYTDRRVYESVAGQMGRCRHAGCACSPGPHVKAPTIKRSHELVKSEEKAGNGTRFFGGKLTWLWWKSEENRRRKIHEEWIARRKDHPKQE